MGTQGPHTTRPPAPKYGLVLFDNWGGRGTGEPSHKCSPTPAPLSHTHIHKKTVQLIQATMQSPNVMYWACVLYS